jgi:universal stress protein A
MLKYTKIMCAFEFDGNSTSALSLASKLASESDATLYVLHIARVPTHDMDVPLPIDQHPRWETEAREKLQKIVDNTVNPQVKLVIDVRSGVPNIDIVRAARELAVDLIVMATHGHTRFAHLLLGSVTEHVIREAPCPVLVLRAGTPASASA